MAVILLSEKLFGGVAARPFLNSKTKFVPETTILYPFTAMKKIAINCEFKYFLPIEKGHFWIKSSLDLDEGEEKFFIDALEKYKDCNPEELKDVCTDYEFYDSGIYLFLYKVLPFSFAKKICSNIAASFVQDIVEDLVKHCPHVYENDIEQNSNITKEQWEDLRFEDKIELLLKCDPYLSDLSMWELSSIEICK